MSWKRCSSMHRCPICDANQWCSYTADGGVACCTKIQSDRPSNTGWIHVLDRDKCASPIVTRQPDRSLHHNLFLERMLLEWWDDTSAKMVASLARLLGVTEESLVEIGAAYCRERNAWAFPMYRWPHKIVGIRFRSVNGRKFAEPLSKEGLFLGDQVTSSGVVVVEGPTDTAAMIDLGFNVIGRPSNIGREDLVIEAVRECGANHVAIFSDNDAPGSKAQSFTRLGVDRLASGIREKVGITVVDVTPPADIKDIRAWKRQGATADSVTDRIHEALNRADISAQNGAKAHA